MRRRPLMRREPGWAAMREGDGVASNTEHNRYGWMGRTHVMQHHAKPLDEAQTGSSGPVDRLDLNPNE